ncbi:MAG: gamma-glutamylcyclotransferase [Alphaproteobacteria bacterium]
MGPFAPLTAQVRRQSLDAILARGEDEIRVFVYGSLMWDAAYRNFDRSNALLPGYRRSFCVWTAHARGTPELPGLGLGLRRDAGARCGGVLIRLSAVAHREILEALWEREMWTGVYDPERVAIITDDGPATALAFIVNRRHPQFAGDLAPAEAARHIALAEGVFGTCREYFYATERALRDIPGTTKEFALLGRLVRREAARAAGDAPSG